jgi:hypothetical protein
MLVFVVTKVAGLGFAMVMAVVEFCFKSNVEAKRSKTTLSDAMKTKARCLSYQEL